MRILYLTAQLPEPPHAGGTLRTNGLLRAVHAAGHEVHLLSFAEPGWEQHRARLAEFCASVETVPPPRRTARQRLRDLLLSDRADMEGRCASPDYAHALTSLLARRAFDLIQIESLEMAAFLPTLQRAAPTTPLIYDAFNAEYEMQRSVHEAERADPRRLPGAVYSWVQWRRLQRFERQVCGAAARVIAVSEADAAALERLAPGCAVRVVPNGIDAAFYAERDSTLDLGPAALVFTGTMGYRPNVDAALWFAEQVLGRVCGGAPQARFFVVGSQPHARLNALRERDDTQVTGFVADVRPFLHAAAVYVAPLRMGSGTRLKLLQAMAAGRPVVSTTLGAAGLDARDGEHLRLADSATEFARAVVDLLSDRDEACRLGRAGAAYVQAHYDWRVIAPRLLAIYDELATHSS